MNGRRTIARRLAADTRRDGVAARTRARLGPAPGAAAVTAARSRRRYRPARSARTLDLAAWVVFVLLDLVLFLKVLQFGDPARADARELRLRRAFARRGSPQSSVAATGGRTPRHSRRRSCGSPHDVSPNESRPQFDRSNRPVRAAVPAAGGTGRPTCCDERIGVLLLGPFELTGCKKKQPRRQATAEFLAYLAIQPRRVSRDELLEALWPGDDPRRSAARFYQAASEARKLLGDAFLRERDTYTLDRQQLLDRPRRARSPPGRSGGGDEEQQRMLLGSALALFRGEPLAGVDALWADTEARRLHRAPYRSARACGSPAATGRRHDAGARRCRTSSMLWTLPTNDRSARDGSGGCARAP